MSEKGMTGTGIKGRDKSRICRQIVATYDLFVRKKKGVGGHTRGMCLYFYRGSFGLPHRRFPVFVRPLRRQREAIAA